MHVELSRMAIVHIIRWCSDSEFILILSVACRVCVFNTRKRDQLINYRYLAIHRPT